MISGRELENLQAAVAPALVDTCVIRRRARTATDSGGEVVGAAVTVYSGACRLVLARSPTEQDQAGAKPEVIIYNVFLPAGTSVGVEDEIVIGDDTYDVTGVTGRGVLVMAQCTRR